MNREALELIGVTCVVLSLVFVGFEIRQNTKTSRSAIFQSVAEQSISALEMMIESKELREAMRAGEDGTATADQKRQIGLYFGLLLRIQQNRFMQAELGTVSLNEMLELGGKAPVYRSEGFKNWWKTTKENHKTDFQRHVELNLMTPDA